jgi:8-oxo-dGTP pyrophosphatase MutT (NUDIX family)
VRDLLERRLLGTAPASDPAAAALAALPDGAAEAWFDTPLVPAAVLIPLVERDTCPGVLLTRRTEHLRDHAGQISFPGGRAEQHDVDAVATALRETHEEIGIAPELIDVVGCLEPQAVITGFAVTPVVGFIAADYSLTLDRYEVEEAFEVPLAFLTDTDNRLPTQRRVRGIDARFCEFHYEGHRIWGATALILNQLVNILNNKNN